MEGIDFVDVPECTAAASGAEGVAVVAEEAEVAADERGVRTPWEGRNVDDWDASNAFVFSFDRTVLAFIRFLNSSISSLFKLYTFMSGLISGL